VLETFIGLTLITGIGLRAGLVVMAGWMVGIMSPVVLFFGDLFPGFTPTLEAQYVLKDIIVGAAGAVVAAQALGARFQPVGRPARHP
jgi:putative oxidoreductase